jgi:hypothetical protein
MYYIHHCPVLNRYQQYMTQDLQKGLCIENQPDMVYMMIDHCLFDNLLNMACIE